MLAERLHKTEAVLRARSQSFNGKGTITVMQWQGNDHSHAMARDFRGGGAIPFHPMARDFRGGGAIPFHRMASAAASKSSAMAIASSYSSEAGRRCSSAKSMAIDSKVSRFFAARIKLLRLRASGTDELGPPGALRRPPSVRQLKQPLLPLPADCSTRLLAAAWLLLLPAWLLLPAQAAASRPLSTPSSGRDMESSRVREAVNDGLPGDAGTHPTPAEIAPRVRLIERGLHGAHGPYGAWAGL